MPDGVVVTVKAKGSIVIEGPIDLRDQDGNPIQPPPGKKPGSIKLCGCGLSLSKPFCDGSHNPTPRAP